MGRVYLNASANYQNLANTVRYLNPYVHANQNSTSEPDVNDTTTPNRNADKHINPNTDHYSNPNPNANRDRVTTREL